MHLAINSNQKVMIFEYHT